MAFKDLDSNYTSGKQTITLLGLILTLLGFILDAATYQSRYSATQIWLQGITVVVCLVCLILYLIDKNKYYVLSFGMLSYGVIINIFFTTVYIHSFTSFADFEEANIISRDVYFIILYIVVAGFIVGEKHIFIQSSLLLLIILYTIFIQEEIFFKANAFIYLISVTGFSLVLRFLVNTVNKLITGMREANTATQGLRQVELSKNQTLLNYQNSLLKLSKDEGLFKNDLTYLYSNICDVASLDLKISRVSIWMLSNSGTEMVRKFISENRVGNANPEVLDRKMYPNYFAALEREPFIQAPYAQEHPDTCEFTQGYLKPLNIISMLDCPIRVDGNTIGVICCEHQGVVREWTREDVLFVQSLSVHISIFLKNNIITDLLNQVKIQNLQLRENSEEIKSINEELNSLNESLEAEVRERTAELETQNKQLTEYAFINSHVLRAPLARILGLAVLIGREVESVKDKHLLESLIASSHELDSIIQRISDILYDGNNLTREDVKAIVNRTLNMN